MPSLEQHLTRSVGSATLLNAIDTETSQVSAVAFSPDGRLLAAADSANTIQLRQVPSGALQSELTTGGGWVLGVAFSPDGKRLAAARANGTINVWSVPAGTCERTFEAHDDDVMAVTFVGPDGRRLASASEDRTVKLWSTSDWACVATLAGHEADVDSLCATPDGKLLASMDDGGTIKVWSVPDGKCLATLSGHDGRRGLCFSPDGRLLAADARDNAVAVWSVAEKKVVATLAGHSDRVRSVQFHPGGKYLASASADSTVRIWNVADGAVAVTLKTGGGQPQGVTFGAGGDLLTWADLEDGKAQVWLLTPVSEAVSWDTAEPELMPRAALTQVRPDGDAAFAGGQFLLGLVIENTGKDALYQLWAEVKSSNPVLDGLRAFVGRLDPGQKAERWLVADLPPDMPAGEIRGEVEFHEANGYAPENFPVVVAVSRMPRPDVPVAWTLVNDNTGNSMGTGDGRPKRGESIDVRVVVENKTGHPLSGFRAQLSADDVPEGVVVKTPLTELPEIPAGGSGGCRVTFVVKPKAQTGPAVFRLRIDDGKGRAFGSATIETVIG